MTQAIRLPAAAETTNRDASPPRLPEAGEKLPCADVRINPTQIGSAKPNEIDALLTAVTVVVKREKAMKRAASPLSYHQDITAGAQKGAADTGRKARAALGIIDLDFRILVIAEGETRPPEPLVKWRQYQASRQVGVAERQGVAIAVHGD
jgi:hypothetical protein